LPVGSLFNDGDLLHDAYSGKRYTVSAKSVRIEAPAKAVLLEPAAP
jgi:hypothetical protein